MIKKALIFLVALLGCLYSVNATENENEIQEDVQTIEIEHLRSGKIIFRDTLYGTRVKYTKNKLRAYILLNIPEEFYDTSEIYFIKCEYYEGGYFKRRSTGSLTYLRFSGWYLCLL